MTPEDLSMTKTDVVITPYTAYDEPIIEGIKQTTLTWQSWLQVQFPHHGIAIKLSATAKHASNNKSLNLNIYECEEVMACV